MRFIKKIERKKNHNRNCNDDKAMKTREYQRKCRDEAAGGKRMDEEK